MVYYSAHIQSLNKCVLLFICLVNLKLLFMNIPVMHGLFTVAAHGNEKIINHVFFCTYFSYAALRLNRDQIEILAASPSFQIFVLRKRFKNSVKALSPAILGSQRQQSNSHKFNKNSKFQIKFVQHFFTSLIHINSTTLALYVVNNCQLLCILFTP